MSCQSPIIAITNVLIFTLTVSILTACKEHTQESGIKQEATTTVDTPNITTGKMMTDQWLGQWNGPEGTFLKITGGDGKYELIIQNLDGPQNYTGISVDDGIQFERNGVMEKIQATNGAETGMKWLSEKSNCLTIHRGEGFCRD